MNSITKNKFLLRKTAWKLQGRDLELIHDCVQTLVMEELISYSLAYPNETVIDIDITTTLDIIRDLSELKNPNLDQASV